MVPATVPGVTTSLSTRKKVHTTRAYERYASLSMSVFQERVEKNAQVSWPEIRNKFNITVFISWHYIHDDAIYILEFFHPVSLCVNY